MSIRVGIIEDHDGFREGLYHILGITQGFKSVGAYSSMEQALIHLPPSDVILLDIGLPGISGLEGLPRIKKKYPTAHVVLLTVSDDDANIFKAIVAGADGYILKNSHPSQILQAIEDAAKGGTPMTPAVAKKVLEMFKSKVRPPKEEFSVSQREKEVLTFLVEGLRTEEIADRLNVSTHTVLNHIRHIYSKLRVHTKTQAVVKAIKHDIV